MLSGLLPLYQNKLQEQGVRDIVNTNKIKFELYGDLFDEVYYRLNETLINNQDPHCKTENCTISGVEYPNDNDSEDTETKLLQSLPLCHIYYQVMKSQKV